MGSGLRVPNKGGDYHSLAEEMMRWLRPEGKQCNQIARVPTLASGGD